MQKPGHVRVLSAVTGGLKLTWGYMKGRKELVWAPPAIAMIILGIMVLLFHEGPRGVGMPGDPMSRILPGYIYQWYRARSLTTIRHELTAAAARNDLSSVKRLLRAEFEIVGDYHDHRSTPLMMAAVHGHRPVVLMLLEKGADPNACDVRGRTALMGAATKGHLDIVRLLVQKGADFNARDWEGWTALMCAAAKGRLDIVRLLVEKGADLNIMNKDWVTALGTAELRNRTEVVLYLKEHGAGSHVDARDRYGRTALILASRAGDLAALKELLDKGADPNARLPHGETALSLASLYGRKEIVELLKAHGARE